MLGLADYYRDELELLESDRLVVVFALDHLLATDKAWTLIIALTHGLAAVETGGDRAHVRALPISRLS